MLTAQYSDPDFAASQLRLVELTFQDRLKEVNDKAASDLEEASSKYDLLLQEKNDMEMDNEERITGLEEKQQDQLQQFEQQYQEKIMAEVERYSALQQEKELMNERWDEQNSLLVLTHSLHHAFAPRRRAVYGACGVAHAAL